MSKESSHSVASLSKKAKKKKKITAKRHATKTMLNNVNKEKVFAEDFKNEDGSENVDGVNFRSKSSNIMREDMPNGLSSFNRRQQSQPRLPSHAAQHSRLGEQIDGLLQNRNASENQSQTSAYSKSLRIQNFSRTPKDRKRASTRKDTPVKNLPNNVAGFEHDYLSATDPEDYQDRISLKNLSQSDK